MNFFIIGRDFNVLATLSTEAPDSLQIFNDKQALMIQNNAVISTFDFSVSTNHQDARSLQLGNYIAFKDRYGEMRLYSMMEYEGDDSIQTWYCEDVGLDLLNQNAEAWDYTGDTHGIEWYLTNKVLDGTGWEIGVNEASELTRTLKFEGNSDTLLKRAGDIANEFGNLELSFSIEMENNHVTKQFVNIWKKYGNEIGQEHYIDNVNLKSLHTKGSIKNLRTALIGIGGQPDSENETGETLPPIDFSSIEYDDGRYYSPTGHRAIYDRISHLEWSRFEAFNYANQSEFDGYLTGTYSYDTKDPNELLNRTLTQLKKVNIPTETYEADLTEIQAGLGDYVEIAHNKFNPPIYLQARLEAVTICYTEKGKDSGILGDYTKLQSQIDPRIKDMIDRLANSVNSNYTWVRYAEDDKGTNMTATPNAKTKYVAFLANRKTGVPSDNPADYAGHWTPTGKDGSNGTPGEPGEDGKTPYFHTAWANDVNGSKDFSTTDSTGRGYMGTYTDFTEADSTDPKKYNWIELVDALVIGGRNYLLDTKNAWNAQGSGGANQASADKWKFTFGKVQNSPLNENDDFVISFNYIYTGTGARGTILAQFNGTPWAQFTGISTAPTTDTGKVVYKGKWKDSWEATANLADGINIRLDNVATTRHITIYNAQFEYGNKATDYKEAPEDTQTLIDSLSTPNLVYNAGLQGGYKNGLDGWTPNGTGAENAWYRTTAPASMYNGVNGMGINYTYPSSGTNVWHIIDSKHHTPIDVGQVFSASVQVKIYADSTAGNVSAVLAFFDSNGNRLPGFYGMGGNPDGSLNGTVDSTNPNRDKWQHAHADGIVAPANAKSVAIQYYVHPKLNTSSKIHVIFSAPVVNVGTKPVQYMDNQGSGSDVTQVNEKLDNVNKEIAAVPKVTTSRNAPANPKVGDQWWVIQTDPDTQKDVIGAFNQWDGTKWAPSNIQQSLLIIKTLDAVNVNGSVINGSEFTNSFSFKDMLGTEYTGVTKIADGAIKIDYKVPARNQTGVTKLQADTYEQTIYDASGHMVGLSGLSPASLRLQNNDVGGFLTPEDLETVGPIVFQTTGGGQTWRAAFFKKFHYVWMSGVLYLTAGSQYNIGNLGANSIFPHDHRFIAIHPLSGTSQYGMLQISPGGDLHVVNAPITERYTIEGLFYRVENL